MIAFTGTKQIMKRKKIIIYSYYFFLDMYLPNTKIKEIVKELHSTKNQQRCGILLVFINKSYRMEIKCFIIIIMAADLVNPV